MRILKDKRGAALVSAVAFMLVMAILGLLLTAAISYSHLQVKSNQAVDDTWHSREEIGEYFVHAKQEEFMSAIGKTNYIVEEASYSNLEKTLILRNARGNVILYIKATRNTESEPWQPTVWRYSEPIED